MGFGHAATEKGRVFYRSATSASAFITLQYLYGYLPYRYFFLERL